MAVAHPKLFGILAIRKIGWVTMKPGLQIGTGNLPPGLADDHLPAVPTPPGQLGPETFIGKRHEFQILSHWRVVEALRIKGLASVLHNFNTTSATRATLILSTQLN